MSVEHGVLGQETRYQFEYNPALLFPVSRINGREILGIDKALPFYGVDRWTAYELSWLDSNGLPVSVIAEFDFPCISPNIIESKSLKLYLNSFNQSVFRDIDSVKDVIAADLARVCGNTVDIRFFTLDNFIVSPVKGYHCIDSLDVTCSKYIPEPALLVTGTDIATQKYCSHLFRSLCPVTGQPDWASVFINCSGKSIIPESLLQYLVSYRNHQGFHEQCVEQIFIDIWQYCQPEKLTVYARFLRRGGLDINPFRSSELHDHPECCRESRQ